MSKPPGQLQAAPLAPALRGEGRVPPLTPGPDPRAGVGDAAIAQLRVPDSEPGASTGVSSAQGRASRVLPCAGAMVQPGPGVRHLCIHTHHPLPWHIAPRLPGNRAFPQPCPPGFVPMQRAGGEGRGTRANSCLVSKGMEKVEMAAKLPFPPPGACWIPATSLLTATLPTAHAGKALARQRSGSGVSPGPLCRRPGHGASLIPLSCSSPGLQTPSPASLA